MRIGHQCLENHTSAGILFEDHDLTGTNTERGSSG